MATKRFVVSADGKELRDTRKNVTISIAKFRVVRSGKITSVLFNEHVPDKAQLKIARFTIDESQFSFGEPTGVAPSKAKGSKGKKNIEIAGVVSFEKSELVALHESQLGATNATLRKLAGNIKDGTEISFTLRELFEMHEFHMNAAAVTFQKLIPQLKAGA